MKNRTLYCGDNLPIMRDMCSESIDLIATDPPFNKGYDFAKFKDKWKLSDVTDESEYLSNNTHGILDIVNIARIYHSEGMAAYLCFLAVRLIEMRRLLKPTGSIYIHCDHSANYYIRLLLDSIFGMKQFRNEIVWCYTGPGSGANHFPRKHDTIFWYSVGNAWTFNKDDIRVKYRSKGGTLIGLDSKLTKEEKKKLTEEYYKRGKLPESWWVGSSGNGLSATCLLNREYVKYPTQKPLALSNRIIRASSNKGDWIFDPFCGSGTTLLAAEKLGRKWIGIDLNDDVYDRLVNRIGLFGKVHSLGRNS